ncbi:hypothetical protein ACFQZC_10640 [Streptacidiphilus monticola]
MIAVHGLGADRQQVLPLLPLFQRLKLPVLAMTYRNDEGRPNPRTASGTSARPSGATWRRRSAWPRAAGRAGWCSTAGRWARRWPCRPRSGPTTRTWCGG